MYFSDNHKLNISESLNGYKHIHEDTVHTNQKAEIISAIRSVETARDVVRSGEVSDFSDGIMVHMDSKYVIDAMTKWVLKWRVNGYKNAGGRPVENRELFRELDYILCECAEEGINVGFQHIPREYNGDADELARLGARK